MTEPHPINGLSREAEEQEALQLESQLNAVFEEYAQTSLQGVGKECDALIALGLMKEEDKVGLIASREQQYRGFDSRHKLAEVLNNFRLWLPGGYYRQLLEEKKQKNVDDPETLDDIQRRSQIIEDIDRIITQGNYSDISLEQNTWQLFAVYLKMVDR